jgi:hypothetical protein
LICNKDNNLLNGGCRVYVVRNGLTYWSPSNDVPEDKEVELCKKWIEYNTSRTKTIRPKLGSYQFKHIVERSCGVYISNGAFIQAAIELGYDYKPCGINADFNMIVKTELRESRH